MTFRNRIIGHRVVRARDLVPHALNPRTHSEAQRETLRDLMGEVGFARSTLAYVADKDKHRGASAPLTLIDGHLRREELGDAEITVEILDVDDEEARKLLLSIDPLASLAGYDQHILDELKAGVETDSDALRHLWDEIADAQRAASMVLEEARGEREPKRGRNEAPECFLVIIECSGEKDQVEALRVCKKKGMNVKAVMS